MNIYTFRLPYERALSNFFIAWVATCLNFSNFVLIYVTDSLSELILLLSIHKTLRFFRPV
jgi:hypothetical protein